MPSVYPAVLPTVYITLSITADGGILLFGAVTDGQNVTYAGVSTATGEILWNVQDPVGAQFTSIPVTPRSGAFVNMMYTSAGGNYGDGQGSGAIDAETGQVAWAVTQTNVVSSGIVVADQGHEFLMQLPGSGSSSTLSVASLSTGKLLASNAYFDSFGFTTGPTVSADGACAYIFGSGSILADNPNQVSLLSFCFNGTALLPEFSVLVTGVDAPSGNYQAAPGPGDGQITLWHQQGVLVMQPYTLQPAPAPPTPADKRAGETIAFMLGKTQDTCSYGAGNVTLSAASLTYGPTGASPSWTLGPQYADFIASGSCNAASGPMPVDAAGRRAWTSFGCLPPGIGSYVTYVVSMDLGGKPGDAPTITGICRARSVGRLFFDPTVNTTAPWFLDAGAEFTRYFYAVTVPPMLPSGDVPSCVFTAIGELSGVVQIPSPSSFASDGAGKLYMSSSSDFGLRVIAVTVPGGKQLMDVRLPCDTSVCVGSGVSIAGASGDSIVVGGLSPYYPDWDYATLVQQIRVTTGNASQSQSASQLSMQPTSASFTGMVSQEFPTFPIQLPATVSYLPAPASSAIEGVSYLQSLYTGSFACTNSSAPALLHSAAITGPRANDSVSVVNVTVPACPLPAGQACYSVSVGHAEAFVQ